MVWIKCNFPNAQPPLIFHLYTLAGPGVQQRFGYGDPRHRQPGEAWDGADVGQRGRAPDPAGQPPVPQPGPPHVLAVGGRRRPRRMVRRERLSRRVRAGAAVVLLRHSRLLVALKVKAYIFSLLLVGFDMGDIGLLYNSIWPLF